MFWFALTITIGLSSCDPYEVVVESRTPLLFSEVKEKGIEGCMEYYLVPGCAWAVLDEEGIVSGTAGSIFDGSKQEIELAHHFQIGSLGKSVTSVMAAKCVEDGLLRWDSKLFDILPEWKEKAHPGYSDLTIRDLLSHRTQLPPLNKHSTHIDTKTGKLVYDDIPNFTGSDSARRSMFCKYALSLQPVEVEGLNYGNSGYSLAGCMMEKVTGKSWEDLALSLAEDLDMNIGFERPNRFDSSQPWGHLRLNGDRLEPVSAEEQKIYNDPILAPAGNIHINILDFSKYVRQFMNGYKKINGYVSSESINYLLSGKENYAMGWYNDFAGDTIFYHYGSEGTFYCHMMFFANLNSAIIIFTNAPGITDTENFINDARNYLKDKYIYI
ncbi:MAG: beta-lactamase family protein [Bacteroidales bacterium]|nr:beta-lactamase family protein [Bacteroidales bacterium]